MTIRRSLTANATGDRADRSSVARIGFVWLLSATACLAFSSCTPEKHDLETYQTKTIIYHDHEYVYIPVLYEQEILELLIDTGAPTFVLEPDSVSSLSGIAYDGYFEWDPQTRAPNTMPRILHLPVRVAECGGECNHQFRRGLVFPGEGIKRLGLDGAVNPSQFAWGGCIEYDLNGNSISKFEYTPQSPKCVFLDGRGNPTETLTHKYTGPVGMPDGRTGRGLYDTGSPVSIFNVSVLTLEANAESKPELFGYQWEAEAYYSKEIKIRVGEEDIHIEQALITSDNLPGEFDAIIGRDVISQFDIIVGEGLPPRLFKK